MTKSVILPLACKCHTPHNPQLADPSIFFPKKRDSFFHRSTTPLVLSAAAGQIKGSCWHPQTAHHLALCWLPYFCRQAVRVGRSVNPAATQVGQNRGKIGESSALGDIPRPYPPPGAWQFTPILSHHPALCWLPYFCRQAVRVRRSNNPAATQVGAKLGWNMIDYPHHRRRFNEDQEDNDDWVSNPIGAEIAAYERWMVEQEQQEPHRREPRQTVPRAPS